MASWTDVEIAQDQGVPSEIQTQEDAQTSTTGVELVDSQSSSAPPKKNNNRNKYKKRICWVTR